MDFELTEDQKALVRALQDVMRDHANIPQEERLKFFFHDRKLQDLLSETGFLDAAREIGALEAALVIYEVAKGLAAIDTIGCGLVAPMSVPERRFGGPVALASEADLDKAIRNLSIAGTLLVESGDDVLVLELDPSQVESVESIFAFPYGRFLVRPNLDRATKEVGKGPVMRQWWRVGLATEIAGASSAAIDYTIDYVKQRHVFGRPVGSFQSVQHRLVQRYGYAKSAYYLAMRAAWSGQSDHADIAACYSQMGVQELLFDLHQFHGAMGVTNEHALHFWTYRIRALQAEAGGVYAAALAAARNRWNAPVPATEPAAERRAAAQ